MILVVCVFSSTALSRRSATLSRHSAAYSERTTTQGNSEEVGSPYIRMCPMVLFLPLFPAPHLASCGLQYGRVISPIPRPSLHPVFDNLQFAKTEWEGLGFSTVWSMAQNHMVVPAMHSHAREKTKLVFCTSREEALTKDVIKRAKHIQAKRCTSGGLPNGLCELSSVTKFC